MELQERLLHPEGGPGSVDEKLQEFATAFEGLSRAMATKSISFSNPAEVPPEVYSLLQKYAIELAQGDPAFLRLYDRFYRRTLGDITTELI